MKSSNELVVALVGQPNCGKSTIFNAVAGFRVDTGNFSGTTVSFTETRITFEGRAIRLIDLPGTYSISSIDLAEKVARDYLLSGRVDVMINVADASILSRSLEFTLQLVEMGIPMVVGLNMFDDARRKGMEIDTAGFRALTGVGAYPVVAVRGEGIVELFQAAIALADNSGAYRPIRPVYDRDVEQCVASIIARYPDGLRAAMDCDPRFAVLRMLEMDSEFTGAAEKVDPAFNAFVTLRRRELAEMHDWPEQSVLSSHRHAVVLDLYEKVVTLARKSLPGFFERLD
ncbi:MAG: FeoB small GTPase domain-containing protein, partial [Myxococcota bacterium]